MFNLGIEIELTGLKRIDLVKALELLFETKAQEVIANTEDMYTYHRVKDMYGGNWVVKRDRSITPEINSSLGQRRLLTVSEDENFDYYVEIASPVLNGNTLPLLFTVVDVCKALGGVVNKSCGIHVHVDKLDVQDCISLYRRFVDAQDEIFQTFGTEPFRLEKYCKRYNPDAVVIETEDIGKFMDWLYINYADFTDVEGVRGMRSLKYYALNFYSLLTHGTIEYRLFNSALDKVEIAKILKWVLNFTNPHGDFSTSRMVLESILVSNISNS